MVRLEAHDADEEVVAPLHQRAVDQQAIASKSLANGALKLPCCLLLAAGGAAIVALRRQSGSEALSFQPRQALDCAWIPYDDCKNTDWAACQCRQVSPDGPCTLCPNPTCKKGCCSKECEDEAAEEAKRAAERFEANREAAQGWTGATEASSSFPP
mmetsp:Transcript_19828/g.56774  ORF Transcript_19828/g.56774 Transcript_19828/m.56774 type:complete len:156 (+) Transcript_19828:114-581(+)